MQKSNITVLATHIIILCHIIDEFEEFQKNLLLFRKKELEKKRIDGYVSFNDISYKIYQASQNKKHFIPRKYKNFYRENKHVIDIINKYSDIASFINFNYNSYNSNKENLNYLYAYILRNKDKIENILALLEKLQRLGFATLEFNPDLDFSNETYEINTDPNFISKIDYLDEVEVIPGYQNGIIRYKTKNSNYKINLLVEKCPGFFAIKQRSIVLNDLTFSPSRLPSSITDIDPMTFLDKLIKLNMENNPTNKLINDAVNLSLGLDAATSSLDDLYKIIQSISSADTKDSLIRLLSETKEYITKMRIVSRRHNDHIISQDERVTQSLLEETTKNEKTRRKESLFHI